MAAPDTRFGVWKDSTADFSQRCVFMDIIGLENSGKTSLALSAPGPTAIIHASEKVRGIVNRQVRAGKKVREWEYGFVSTGDKKADVAAAGPVWRGVTKAYKEAVGGFARSVIVDTGNEFWSMARFGTFGELNPKGNRMDALYGPINQEIRSLLATHYRRQLKSNVITTHMMGDEYKDRMRDGKMTSIKTGRAVRKGGFKEIPFIAEVIVECFRGDDDSFKAKVKKGWFRADVENIDIDDETMQALGYSGLNFPSIMAWITETPESEWAR